MYRLELGRRHAGRCHPYPIAQYNPPQEAQVSADDYQVSGSHYQSLSPQPWDVSVAWNLGFLEGNILKYLARYKVKGGIDDLRKARHYLDKLIELETS